MIFLNRNQLNIEIKYTRNKYCEG